MDTSRFFCFYVPCCWLEIRPPVRAWASSILTSNKPDACNFSAAASPAAPAPMMTTVVFVILFLVRDPLHSRNHFTLFHCVDFWCGRMSGWKITRCADKIRYRQTVCVPSSEWRSGTRMWLKVCAGRFCFRVCALWKSILPRNEPTKLGQLQPNYGHSNHPSYKTKLKTESKMVANKKWKKYKQRLLNQSINQATIK